MTKASTGRPSAPDPNSPKTADSAGGALLVLYDDGCRLCRNVVRFVRANDPAAQIAFASLTSPAAAAAVAPFGRTPDAYEGVVAVEPGAVAAGADGALRIARAMRAPWPIVACVAARVPRRVRDAAYGWVARNRVRWFGRCEP